MWKQRIISSLWWLLGICLCGLLTAGMQYKKHLPCNGITVNIERVNGHVFIDEKEIIQLLKKGGAATGKPISAIPLQQLEKILNQQPWIYNAELFFDNNQVLQVSILEREPLARIFTSQGSSFYIDSSGMRLPLSNDYAARVPMFTSFTSAKEKLSKPDSALMLDIRKIAMLIQQDSFWMAQVSQVNITPNKTFEVIPVLGNQVIKLGNADSLESKFDRLTAFYKQIWAKENFEKYESISVEFSGQIVAVKRNAPKAVIDIPQAQRLINAMRNGERLISDTATASVIAASQLKRVNEIADSAQQKTAIIPKNRSISSNKKAKQFKQPLAAKNKNGNTPKAVMKKKK